MACRIFVGHLPRDVDRRDIEDYFDRLGKIREVVHKGHYAFVEYADERDAKDAIHDLNGASWKGERLIVEVATGRRRSRSRSRERRRRDERRRRPRITRGPPRRTDFQISIDNLSTRVSWQDLKDIFGEVARVVYADAHNKRRNYGIVEFDTKDEMNRVYEKFNGKSFNGRKIEMEINVKTRRSRSRSRGRSRSRDGSHSREKSRDHSRSRSRSRGSRDRKRSHSRDSKSKDRSRSRSKESKRSATRSRSGSQEKRSRSRSASPAEHNGSPRKDDRAASMENGSPKRSQSPRKSDLDDEDKSDHSDN